MGESPHADTIASHIPAVAVLPGGEYLMGCDRGRADEQPVHGVRVDAFAMGITTVTNEQYRVFCQSNRGADARLVFGASIQPSTTAGGFSQLAAGRRLLQLAE